VSHPSSGKTLTIDELSQIEQYGHWLNQRINELTNGTTHTTAAAGS
jgi:hypothetical protein